MAFLELPGVPIVAHIDAQRTPRDAAQPRTAPQGLQQEIRILPQRGIGIPPMMLPQAAPENQSAAAHVFYKQPAKQCPAAGPELGQRPGHEQHVVEPGDIRQVVQNGRGLAAQALRAIPVVIVPMRDQFAPRHADRFIALGADAGAGRHSDAADARVINASREVGLLLVDDDEFQRGIVLPLEVADRLRNKGRPPPRGHDTAQQG